MNPLELTLMGLLLLLAFWGWRNWLRLRRALDEYANFIRRAASEEAALPARPVNPSLEALADAVEALGLRHQKRYLDVYAGQTRQAALLEQMTEGVLAVSPEGLLDFANPAAERILGQNALLGRSVVEALRDYRLVNLWRDCQQSGATQTEAVEIPLRRQRLQISILPDQNNPGAALILLHDLTRLHRLETVRRDFISNLSHELRTPLASLKALTETLREGALQDPPAAEKFLARMETEVDSLIQMSAELLDLSRIESGQLALNLAPLQPADLLQSAAERMKAQAERTGLRLEVNLTDSLPRIQADFQRLEQVLVNLIHNAVKFTPAGGEIELSARTVETKVEFSVRDTGLGIPVEAQTRIFERFYRVDRARTRSADGGSGLGLAICRHLVEAHGGKIGVESREGQGSRFFFTV